MGATCSQRIQPFSPDEPATFAPPQQQQQQLRDRGGVPSFQRRSGRIAGVANLADTYDVEEVKIGEGSYGFVCLGRHKASGLRRAIKSIPRAATKAQDATREAEMLGAMDHENVVRLYEAFEERRSVHLAMELLEGGELFDRVLDRGRLSEDHTAVVMQQILQAGGYVHSKDIAHRDLKPENFLFSTTGPIEANTLKLIDFGLACACPPGQVLRSKIGTPAYVAPQVLLGRYDKLCDVWSAGVIMYVLLSGRQPFQAATEQETLSRVRHGLWTMDDDYWQHVSKDGKELLRMLMRMATKSRFSAAQALQHAWIKNRGQGVQAEPPDVAAAAALNLVATPQQTCCAQEKCSTDSDGGADQAGLAPAFAPPTRLCSDASTASGLSASIPHPCPGSTSSWASGLGSSLGFASGMEGGEEDG